MWCPCKPLYMVTWVDGSRIPMCYSHAMWARKVIVETLGGYIHLDPDDLKPEHTCEQIVNIDAVVAATRRQIEQEERHEQHTGT